MRFQSNFRSNLNFLISLYFVQRSSELSSGPFSCNQQHRCRCVSPRIKYQLRDKLGEVQCAFRRISAIVLTETSEYHSLPPTFTDLTRDSASIAFDTHQQQHQEDRRLNQCQIATQKVGFSSIHLRMQFHSFAISLPYGCSSFVCPILTGLTPISFRYKGFHQTHSDCTTLQDAA